MDNITITPLQIIDLFFNFDNPNITYGHPEMSFAELVEVDATNFASHLGKETDEEFIQWLVDSFIERIWVGLR